MPDAATVDLLLDKSKFYPWATRQGFAVPTTIEVSGFAELERALGKIGYPVLLKPKYRTERWDREIPGDKVFILERPDQYAVVPRNIFDVSPVLLAQQWIPGTDADIYFCLVCYDRQGKLMDSFCGRKLMQWPPLGGSTAIAISDEQKESLEPTLALFNAVGYQGLGSMEYKKNPQTGQLYIIEPTVGRNDFQSLLAVTGNVNLTGLVCRDALGIQKASCGLRRRSAWICEPSLYYAVKRCWSHGDMSFLRFFRLLFRRTGFAYADWHDMAPFITFVKSRLR
jgi:predicted ATP-grasp superfamily ATP-dependent carboligase